MLLPKAGAGLARMVALGTALGSLAFGLAGAGGWVPGKIETITDAAWIPALGIHYHLAADGISLTLVWLTGLAAVAGILFSWNIEYRAREFFALYLTLIGAVYGVFLSFDLFLLFVFYEIAIIPKYFIIAIWGSTRREYGAMKLALYSFIGSALVLFGILAAFAVAGAKTMSLLELATYPFPHYFQLAIFPVVFVGFGILAGLWPLHTWAPTGHVAAPTAASMLLAGVVMKLGAYGCLRVAMTLFPEALGPWDFKVLGFASWPEVFALLGVIGIGYGATVALVQKDLKFVIGYSSISHMGFVLLGLMTLNQAGLAGAVLQMFSHGIIAGLLFAVVGRMLYERTHTRDLEQLRALNLGRTLPFAAVTFTLAGMASMGLPGFSGFVAELQILIGTWQDYPTLAVLAGFGILVGVAYTLRVIQKTFFPDLVITKSASIAKSATDRKCEPDSSIGAHSGSSRMPAHEPRWEVISLPEKLGALLLLGTALVIGLYPRLLLEIIVPSFNSGLFDWLRKEGGWR